MFILFKVKRSTSNRKYLESTADLVTNLISAISPCKSSKEPSKPLRVEDLSMFLFCPKCPHVYIFCSFRCIACSICCLLLRVYFVWTKKFNLFHKQTFEFLILCAPYKTLFSSLARTPKKFRTFYTSIISLFILQIKKFRYSSPKPFKIFIALFLCA